MKLLHIDSSILGPNSVSRTLSAGIVERQKALHPGLEVVYRDLAADGSAHLTGAHMAAWQGAPVTDAALGEDLAKGGSYIDELAAADIIVIGAPMYNFTVPTQLKAWIDRVVVAGKTFRYTETGAAQSLLPTGKKVFIASSRGGAAYGEGAPAAFLEHHETYLKGILGFIGLTDVTVIRAEGLAMGPDARAAALSSAQDTIQALAA
jgi:FMN-dependent NADH-azoreductase